MELSWSSVASPRQSDPGQFDRFPRERAITALTWYIHFRYTKKRYRGFQMTTTGLLKSDLLDFLPLSMPSFFVLFALGDGEKHGYLIMQEIATLSSGTLKMGPATLYTTIQKLVDGALIEEVENDTPDRRRTYCLTRRGKQVLQAEFQRQSDVLQLAKTKKIFLSEAKA
ncbi:MAG: PadR family transcriptional regulator [Acidobacteriaceae bacterium]